MNVTQPIFLIGFMGCGKTTLGSLLAKFLSCEFIDLDEVFVRCCSVSISDFLALYGETYFRKKECEIYYSTMRAVRPRTIIATGGGFPCFFDNMQQMNNDGCTVYLQTPIEVLMHRIVQNISRYPLITPANTYDVHQQIRLLMNKREGVYMRARYTISLTSTSIGENVRQLLSHPPFTT